MIFCEKNQNCQKNRNSNFFFLVFLSSGISQPVLLRLHLSLPGMSFRSQFTCPSFVLLRSLSVASRLSLVSPRFFPSRLLSVASRLSLVSPPARPLSVASRQFLAFAPFLVPSWHCPVASRLSLVTPQVLCQSRPQSVASRLC